MFGYVSFWWIDIQGYGWLCIYLMNIWIDIYEYVWLCIYLMMNRWIDR